MPSSRPSPSPTTATSSQARHQRLLRRRELTRSPPTAKTVNAAAAAAAAAATTITYDQVKAHLDSNREDTKRYILEADMAYVRGLLPHVALVLCDTDVVAEYSTRSPIPDPGYDGNFHTKANPALLAIAERIANKYSLFTPAHVPWPQQANLHYDCRPPGENIQAWYDHMLYLQRRYAPLIRAHYAPVYDDDTKRITNYYFVQAFGLRSGRRSAELRRRFATINPSCAAYMELFNAALCKANPEEYAYSQQQA